MCVCVCVCVCWVGVGSLGVCRVGRSHIYTVYIRSLWQGNHQRYGHTRCVYTVLANSRRYSLTSLRIQAFLMRGFPALCMRSTLHGWLLITCMNYLAGARFQTACHITHCVCVGHITYMNHLAGARFRQHATRTVFVLVTSRAWTISWALGFRQHATSRTVFVSVKSGCLPPLR